MEQLSNAMYKMYKMSYTVPENRKYNGKICGFDDIKNNDQKKNNNYQRKKSAHRLTEIFSRANNS